ncbi:MAG: chromosome segregation protein SMC [Melioribacter sp.]|nr:chromosome segregation protein SMC [Melioribacter sp.]
MFLSKLEIFGFKSFANKTVINFNRGITGIVGPNGCGKTNIVDAIRWVLGEQKSTTLRSDKMENVIFNGTREKKPMGMAEVSLTLVNDKGILPTEYSEVTITRRIFRSGESEYLLNKNICRLKDITNLFMDTGIGANAYSVIELKMVETILSNKADERRRLFEEAAGVNKYKLRRRLSLKKLDDIKADLTRVNDIVSEVEKNVRSLERQAKRADQYTQIQSILKDKEINLAEREYSLYNKEKEIFLKEIAELSLQKEEIDKQIRTIEDELITYRNNINSIEAELQKKRLEIADNSNKLYQLQKQFSVTEEKLNSLFNNYNRIEKEIEEFQENIKKVTSLKEEAEKELDKLNNLLNDKSLETNKDEKLVSEKRNLLEEKRIQLKAINEERYSLIKEISAKENLLATLKKEISDYNERIEKLNQKILNITTRIAKTVGYIEELSNEKIEAEKKLSEISTEFVVRENEKSRLEKELNKLKEKEIEQKTVLISIKEKINFLETLIANLEGLSSGSKALLENKKWTTKEKSIFADVGNTQEKYRFALEAALKFALNNLIIENLDELKEAIKFLKENELGKASFIVSNSTYKKTSLIDKINQYKLRKKIRKIEKEPSFIGWAVNYVETTEQWKLYFKQLLFKVALVNNFENALSLFKKYPDFSFVTLEGDFIQNNGIIEAGSLPKQEETIFGRKQLLENLKNEYPTIELTLEKLKSEINQIEEEINNIDLKNLSDKEKLIANDIANIEKQISQLEYEKKKADEEIENSRKEIQELAEKSNLLDNQLNGTTELLNSLYKKREEIDKKVDEFEKNLKEIEEVYSSSLNLLNEKKLEIERLKGSIKNISDTINHYENEIINTSNGIEKRKNDLIINQQETENLKNSLSNLNTELNKISEIKSLLELEESKIEEQLAAIKSEASKFENQLRELRNKRQEVSDKIHSLEIKVNEYNYKIENIKQHINENYNIDLELKEFDDLETFNYEETSKEVHALKEKLKNLGPVNLLAYSEYEEEKKRLDFLHQQRDDLIESEKDLIKTINEINETAQKLFLDTFEQIRKNFIKIFQTLFNPEDEADLILEENADPLEAKIEIVAKPKGKRPTSIELLSGGEKTLTATALLFAIYLVKPSPFCILDEVDAPLDDANIDRFTKLLKEFSKDTQFIIVTHNKRTMEAAETMYGVTMQEEGVSKLVGVKFEEIPEYQD